jgi:hypothetical protein
MPPKYTQQQMLNVERIIMCDLSSSELHICIRAPCGAANAHDMFMIVHTLPLTQQLLLLLRQLLQIHVNMKHSESP